MRTSPIPAIGQYALEALTIHRHPLVQPGMSITFSPGPNLILGRNGTGKTTLLRILAMICSGSFEELKYSKQPVDIEFSSIRHIRGDSVESPALYRLRCRISVSPKSDRRRPNPHLMHLEPVDIPPSQAEPEPAWHFELDLYRETNEPSSFSDTPIVSLRGNNGEWTSTPKMHTEEGGLNRVPVSPFHRRFILRLSLALLNMSKPIEGDIPDASRLLEEVQIRRLLLLHSNYTTEEVTRFDESLEYFNSITTHDSSALRSTGFTRDGFSIAPTNLPRSLTSLLVGEVDTAQVDLSRCLPLERTAQLFGAEKIVATPYRVEKSPDGRETFLGFDFQVSWKTGITHSHQGLSFGQKRLLAFQWLLEVNPDAPVITDELANGLHSVWVRECLSDSSARQTFHAVQNPLIVDMLGHLPAKRFASSFVFCKKADEGLFEWKNPTKNEAELIERSLSVGLQTVSEALMDRCLW